MHYLVNTYAGIKFHCLLFLAQLWKLNSDNQLINKIRKWKYHTKSWNVPAEGEVGNLGNQDSGFVLGLSTTNEHKIILTEKSECSGQTWLRSSTDVNGWFRLTNCKTGRFLAAPKTTLVTNTGDYIYQICTFV